VIDFVKIYDFDVSVRIIALLITFSIIEFLT